MTTTTTPTNNIGDILSAWDGEIYDRLGYPKHLIVGKSDTAEPLLGYGGNWYLVFTACVNANGKILHRGYTFWVSPDGSIRPTMNDNPNEYHSWHRIPKYMMEYYLERIGMTDGKIK
jgi:hypothetical protein